MKENTNIVLDLLRSYPYPKRCFNRRSILRNQDVNARATMMLSDDKTLKNRKKWREEQDFEFSSSLIETFLIYMLATTSDNYWSAQFHLKKMFKIVFVMNSMATVRTRDYNVTWLTQYRVQLNSDYIPDDLVHRHVWWHMLSRSKLWSHVFA